MDITAVAIQVPFFALLCFLVFKLGKLLISRWATNDAERTVAIAKGFSDITAVLLDLRAEITGLHEHLGLEQTAPRPLGLVKARR